MVIPIIAPTRVFLDRSYKFPRTGEVHEFLLMGEADGAASMTDAVNPGIRSVTQFGVEIVADVDLTPDGPTGDGVYLLNAGKASFLLIGRLVEKESNRPVKAGDRISISMLLKLNSGEYLDLLPLDEMIPLHVCEIGEIRAGTRETAPSRRHDRSPVPTFMRNIVWRNIDYFQCDVLDIAEGSQFLLLDCRVTGQVWRNSSELFEF